jgi:uncharacterized protein (TIGR03085 family)
VPASLAHRERLALVSTAREVGPSAPTLCAEWDVRALLCHLVLRERRPWVAAGSSVPPLRGLAERVSTRLARRPFEELLDTVAEPAALLRRWEALNRLMNTVELFVHHEDIRRAQPGWTVRPLPPEDGAQLWRSVRQLGRLLVRPAGVPVVITDGRTVATLRGGPEPVTVSGAVSELTLFLFGRKQLDSLELDGPPARVAALRAADLHA